MGQEGYEYARMHDTQEIERMDGITPAMMVSLMLELFLLEFEDGCDVWRAVERFQWRDVVGGHLTRGGGGRGEGRRLVSTQELCRSGMYLGVEVSWLCTRMCSLV